MTFDQRSNSALKDAVKAFWESEPCGTRYGTDHEVKRYQLEPYILPFADFASARGKRVLEIGIGRGADFVRWARHAEHAVGVDLTNAAIKAASERMSTHDSSKYALRQADAENLPFPDESFDIVYSWGVLHHSPDTARCFREAARVLRPGGIFKAMVYHPYSWTTLLLWIVYGAARLKPWKRPRRILEEHLESPGTKAFTRREGLELLKQAGLTSRMAVPKLCGGDLLDIELSPKYACLKPFLRFYPRWLVRLCGDRFGLHLLLSGIKPDGPIGQRSENADARFSGSEINGPLCPTARTT